jgi:hypothetical protein
LYFVFPDDSNKLLSHGSIPNDIIISALVILDKSLGFVSKCIGQAPGGIIYSIFTFSFNRFFVKSANIELVQQMLIVVSSALIDNVLNKNIINNPIK